MARPEVHPTAGRGAKGSSVGLARWRKLEDKLPDITRERLRVMNKWLFWLWVFPGIPVSFYLRNSVAWVVFLSAYAIIVAHLIEWRQEDDSSRDET
jgi:hypothetical protein